jgi:hypothetical protein
MSWGAEHALNHGNHADALEQLHLSRIFLKHLRERKSLNGSLALVICGRLDSYVRGVASFAVLDGKKASIASL